MAELILASGGGKLISFDQHEEFVDGARTLPPLDLRDITVRDAAFRVLQVLEHFARPAIAVSPLAPAIAAMFMTAWQILSAERAAADAEAPPR